MTAGQMPPEHDQRHDPDGDRQRPALAAAPDVHEQRRRQEQGDDHEDADDRQARVQVGVAGAEDDARLTEEQVPGLEELADAGDRRR